MTSNSSGQEEQNGDPVAQGLSPSGTEHFPDYAFLKP